MDSLQIDLSGKLGIISSAYSDLTYSTAFNSALKYNVPEGFTVSGYYNPLRLDGYLSPSHSNLTTVTVDASIPNALITSSVYDPIYDKSYIAERGREIYIGSGLDDTTFVSAKDVGASAELRDLEVYDMYGTPTIYYLYKDSSNNMEIGRADLASGTWGNDNADWLTGGAGTDCAGDFAGAPNTLSDEAFMRTSGNGYMYIFQDNVIHRIDGTTAGGTYGTSYANIITFANTQQITDAIEWRNNFYVCIRKESLRDGVSSSQSQSNEVGVYVWNKQENISLTRSDFIPVTGIKAIRKIYITPNGSLRIIVSTPDNLTQIREFNGSVFKIIKTLARNTFPPYHDSLTQFGNYTMWLGQNGDLFLDGNNNEESKGGIFKLFNISSFSKAGALLYGSDSYTTQGFYLCYNDGAEKVRKYEINDFSTTAITGNIYFPTRLLPQMSTLKNLEIYCMPTSSATESTVATIKLYANQSTTAFKAYAVKLSDTNKGYIDIELNKLYVNSLQIEIEFSGTITAADYFAPYIGILIYEPTNTKG